MARVLKKTDSFFKHPETEYDRSAASLLGGDPGNRMWAAEHTASFNQWPMSVVNVTLLTLTAGLPVEFLLGRLDQSLLAAMTGFTELAKEDARLGISIEKHLREVLLAGEWARDLIKQILTFSRRTDPELKPVKVSTIAREVLKLIRATSAHIRGYRPCAPETGRSSLKTPFRYRPA